MSPLPKHLRPRWRYLAVDLEAWPDADLDRGAFQRECWYTAQNLVGDVGSARADLRVLGFEFAEGRGEAVVRTRHDAVAEARAALACVDDVDGHPVRVTVRGVSGTVRACEEKYLGRGGEPPRQSTVVFEDAARDAVTRGRRVDVRTDRAFAGATRLDLE